MPEGGKKPYPGGKKITKKTSKSGTKKK